MPPQENQLPPFTGSEQPRPQPDMANIHITALRQHLTVTTVKNLLSSLTTSWLLTKKGRTCPDAVRLWRSAVEEHFDAERLQELHKDYGNLGRIALLHILEFTLFEVVKKAIVEKQEQGIENAVAELSQLTKVGHCFENLHLTCQRRSGWLTTHAQLQHWTPDQIEGLIVSFSSTPSKKTAEAPAEETAETVSAWHKNRLKMSARL